jgi:hypothetical protein
MMVGPIAGVPCRAFFVRTLTLFASLRRAIGSSDNGRARGNFCPRPLSGATPDRGRRVSAHLSNS